MHITSWPWRGGHPPISYPIFSVACKLAEGTRSDKRSKSNSEHSRACHIRGSLVWRQSRNGSLEWIHWKDLYKSGDMLERHLLCCGALGHRPLVQGCQEAERSDDDSRGCCLLSVAKPGGGGGAEVDDTTRSSLSQSLIQNCWFKEW